jgi:phage terminase large subunit-like protein
LASRSWPERFDAEHHARTRRRVGERVWAALYQQKPKPPAGGVWQREWLDDNRVSVLQFGGLDMARIVVSVDPAGGESAVADETGIIGAARGYDGHLYVLEDRSASMGANDWGLTACRLALALKVDAIVVEKNYGGDMARLVVTQAWEQLRREGTTAGLLMPMVLEVTAKHGKRLRAEPIAQLYEQGLVHHVGNNARLEDQMVTWVAGMDSPDRMDAAVHAMTELADPNQLAAVAVPGRQPSRRTPMTAFGQRSQSVLARLLSQAATKASAAPAKEEASLPRTRSKSTH